MGGTSSTSEASVVTSIISNALTTTMVQNNSYVAQNQEINIVGNNNIISGVTMGQQFQIDTETVTNTSTIDNMQSNIITQLNACVDAQTQGFFDAMAGGTVDSVKSDIANNIESTITEESITTISNQVNQSQSIVISGNANIIKNIGMQEAGYIITASSSDLVASNTFLTTLDNVITQTATSEQANPFDVVTDWLDSVGNTIGDTLGIGLLGAWAPVLLFIIVISVIYLTGRKKSIQTVQALTSPYLTTEKSISSVA